MDKFVEILAKQNPDFEGECANPECKKKVKLKTKDVFSAKDGTYTFTCSSCGNTTTLTGIDKTVNSLKKQFKDMGISW